MTRALEVESHDTATADTRPARTDESELDRIFSFRELARLDEATPAAVALADRAAVAGSFSGTKELCDALHSALRSVMPAQRAGSSSERELLEHGGLQGFVGWECVWATPYPCLRGTTQARRPSNFRALRAAVWADASCARLASRSRRARRGPP